MPKLNVLHLCGSPENIFFCNLSRLYAENTITPSGISPHWCFFTPEGSVSAGPSLDQLAPVPCFMDVLQSGTRYDLAISHMYCRAGLGEIRSQVEDECGIRLFGSSPETIKLAQRKSATKACLSSNGVLVAPGAALSPDDSHWEVLGELGFPLIVKPDASDNSEGLSLVRSIGEFDEAVKYARQFGPNILVEKYIAGREIRAGMLDQEGEHIHLPLMEYSVSADHPIRQFDDKLNANQGRVMKASSSIDAVCPAETEPCLRDKIERAASAAHRALGARDFSLFDFRIDQYTGEPLLLEACPYWSLSPESIISQMITAGGGDLKNAVETAIISAAGKTKEQGSSITDKSAA
ncbi:MAG: hypothetical protein AAF583_00195 [Pseudomonadota bacterium]